jgi:hypothetical protein
MTETTDAVEPWVAVGPPAGGFFDEPSFLLPGPLAAWRREQAQIAAEERRKEEERAERADLRQAAALFEARQYSLARGLPWDPQRPFANVPNVYQRADAAFAMQDREARHADLVAAQQAGLVHLLHQGVESPPVASPGDAAPPASRASAPGVAARANPLGTKFREAFTRWAARSGGHRSTGCGCAACDPEALHRADAEAGLPPREITRTYYEGARIR